MNVAELTAALRQYPPDLPVMTLGYEGGYVDLTPAGLNLRPVQKDVHDVNEEWYYGPHDDPDPEDPRPTQEALILGTRS